MSGNIAANALLRQRGFEQLKSVYQKSLDKMNVAVSATHAIDISKNLEHGAATSADGDCAVYKSKVRNICGNLREDGEKTGGLAQRLCQGSLCAETVAWLDESQLCGDERRSKIAKADTQAANRCLSTDVWQAQNAGKGMFQCGKCRSDKTTFYQQQTRSADEPMTIFAMCYACKFRWKM